jgi:phage-related protein (TIGR01555 family)
MKSVAKNKATPKFDSKAMAARLDGWINTLTGLGIEGRDKSQSSRAFQRLLNKEQVENLYQVDDIAAKIVDLPVEEMFREGFRIAIKEDPNNEIVDWIWEEIERLKALQLLEKQIKGSRLYGGACMYFGIRGQDLRPQEPLKEENIPALDYLFVFDRYQLKPVDTKLENNLKDSLGFGEPILYELDIRDAKEKPTFHKTRLMKMDGVTLPYALAKKNKFWGDSVLSRVYDALSHYRTANTALGALAQDFSVPVLKIQDLVEMVAQADEKLFEARVKLLSLMSSSLNAIVLRENESYERLTLNTTGVPEIMKVLRERLVAASGIPHTLLFGEGPGGSLGGTGTSEKMDWYDTVRSKQNTLLNPSLMNIIKMICLQKSGKTRGQVPPGISLLYNPLWQLTEKEQLELRKAQADIDAIYIDRGVFTAEEVAISRFGSGEYSYETQIDLESRESFENTESFDSDETEQAEEENDDVA